LVYLVVILVGLVVALAAVGSGLLEPVQAVLAAQATMTPIPSPTPSPTPLPTATPLLTTDYCTALPAATLTQAYFQARRSYSLGCPQGNPGIVQAAFQRFERGGLLWLNGVIYIIPSTALSGTVTAAWLTYADTWDESKPSSDPSLTPPDGLQQPIRGFGQLWREQLGGPAAAIGWAVEAETGYQATVQALANGLMVTLPNGEALINCSSCSEIGPAAPPAEQPVWQIREDWGEGFVELEAGASGEVWAITPARLFRFEGEQQANFLVASNFLTETQSSSWRFDLDLIKIAVAPDGSLWLATTYGVYHAIGDTWPHWLADKAIYNLAFDGQGRVWVVGRDRNSLADKPSDFPGLIKFFDGAQWQDFPPPEMSTGISFEPHAIVIPPDGTIWISPWGGQVYQYDGQRWLPRGLAGPGPENWLVMNRRGQVWGGGVANRGWARWQDNGWHSPALDFPNYPAALLAVDEAGNAWGALAVSCYWCKIADLNRTGAIYYSDEAVCWLTAQDGLGGPPLNPQPLFFEGHIPRPDAVFDIAVGTDGSVWFITQGKITVFRPRGPVCAYDVQQ
jgi:hypothetical protein